MMKYFPQCVLTAAVLGLSLAAQAQSTPVTVLHCGRAFDAAAGKMMGPTTIVIEGERISEVAPGAGSRTGAKVVDLANETCLPGLIDAHTHITSEYGPTQFSDRFTLNTGDVVIRGLTYAKRTLLAGFTTIRNLGDENFESVAMRNEINKGWAPGPRILTAGQAIGSTGGHADHTDGLKLSLQGDPHAAEAIINSPEDAWKAIRQHYKEGADVIKIMSSGGVLDLSSSVDNSQLTEDEIKAIVAAAKDYGFAVAVHAHGAEAIRRSVVAGVDSIEHGTWMSEEDMRLMKEHGTWYVPTIYTANFVTDRAKNDPNAYQPVVRQKALMVGPQLNNTVAAAYKAGVKFAYGTDAGVFPHGQNWKDFPLLVQQGLPPAYTLQMATLNAAQLLRQDKNIGTLAAGKYADVVAVPGNPIDDINLMGKVDFVMKGGQIYKQGGQEQVFPDHPRP
jgi:imidazolonepropionase-like amidohydrolase